MPKNLTKDLLTLVFQAPVVIALRCQLIATAAWKSPTGKTAETRLMVLEKSEAAAESVLQWNTGLTKLGLVLFRNLWLAQRTDFTCSPGTTLIASAVAPYARRVRANSRRLNRH
jgi:hypothetical protein